MKLYKVLGDNGQPCNGGAGEWLLPKGNRPGKWMPAIKGPLVPCLHGYHLCRCTDLIKWLGSNIYEAEYRGELVKDNNKVVVREVRLLRRMNWDDSIARHFACDCAERVLHIYEKEYPDDLRVRNCIEIARKVANGELPIENLGAARDASADAARGASAASAAAWAASAAGDAGWGASAARDAAWAARDASAAWAARDARDAEKNWQTLHLFEYLEGKL